MTPAQLHHLQKLSILPRETPSASDIPNYGEETAAASASNTRALIAGGCLGLLVVFAATGFLISLPIRERIKKRRQKKEMDGYAMELQIGRENAEEDGIEMGVIGLKRVEAGEGHDKGGDDKEIDIEGSGKGKMVGDKEIEHMGVGTADYDFVQAEARLR